MASESKVIVYIGCDANYFNELKKRFQSTYPSKFEFVEINSSDVDKLQQIYVRLFSIKPDIIYQDFSNDLQHYVNLAKLIKREFFFRPVPVTGLVENMEDARQVAVAGVDFIHIKSGEYHDVVYDPYFVKFPKEVQKPKFAVAKYEKELFLKEGLRVAYITPTHMHVEGDAILEEGQVIELKHNIPERVIPSKKFVVKKISSEDLYFDHKFSYDFEFIYVDQPQKPKDPKDPDLAEKEYKEAMAEYEVALKKSKQETKLWIEENMGTNEPKKTKVLIIDKSISILNQSKDVDSFPYLIRCQAYLSEKLGEIHRYRPSLFAFQLPDPILTEDDDDSVEGANSSSEDNDDLVSLFQKSIKDVVEDVKKITGYKPFILIYNCKDKNSTEFQQFLDYPLCIASRDKLTIDNVVELADIYEKKQKQKHEAAIDLKYKELKKSDPAKFRNLQKSDLEEKRYYIRRTNSLSFVYYIHPITLQTISESEMTFLCDAQLKKGMFKIEFPQRMATTIVPVDGNVGALQSGRYAYHAMLNAYEENTKKAVRKVVNEVYTQEVRDKEAKAKADFDALNAKAKQDTEAKKKQAEQPAQPATEVCEKDGFTVTTEKTLAEEGSPKEKDQFGFEKD